MKATPTLHFSIRRLFLLMLVSFVAVAALLAIAASANKESRAAKARAELAANSKSAINPATLTDNQPNAPAAASIAATLTDNITAATKVAPGANINYTATITNTGSIGPDDAINLNFSAPLDANTTLVAGSVHASPIARNDTYNWIGNTVLDTSARALPAVTANDVAVNAPGGTDTFTVTAIAGGATPLGGTVTLASPSGAFTYTPPAGRPSLGDGASVNDSFTYTITNSADPTLTSTGTVTITLTGRVWYLQAGAAGDGRSGTPSSSPSAMSTAADKSSDIFYIFSSGSSLNGLFTVDAGQQLLGSGVNLAVTIPTLGSVTLFNSAAPTPTTTNSGGNCVTLDGAPGNNTLSGFNIGNCSGVAIAGSNVGTLNVSTVSINTTGQGLDLTGSGAPSVNVVLGGLTSSGGAKNVNLVGLNGTINLAGGALSGATGNGFDLSGGAATTTYTGTISNSGAKQVNIANMTGGSVTFGGNVSGTGTGVNLSTNTTGTITFRGGMVLSTGANNAFNADTSGTINVCDENPCVPAADGALVNTLTTTSGIALNVTSANIGANNLEFQSISASGGTNGIVLSNTGSAGGLTVTGNGGVCTFAVQTCTGGTIQSQSANGISLTSTTKVSLNFMRVLNVASVESGTCDDLDVSGCRGALKMTGTAGSPVTTTSLKNVLFSGSGEEGITGFNVRGFKIEDSEVRGFGQVVNENGIHILNLSDTGVDQNLIEDTIVDGLATATPCASAAVHIRNTGSTSLSDLSIRRGTFKGTEDGIRLTVRDSSNSSFLVTNVSMPGRLQGDGIDLAVGNSGDTSPIGNIVVQNNTLQNSGFGFGGIVLAAVEHGRGTWTVRDNTISNNGGTAISIAPWSKFNTTTAVVARNNIDCPGGDGTIPGNTSGANPCRVGIAINIQKEDGGGAGENGMGQIYVDTNTISRAPVAVGAIIRTGLSAGGRLDVRVRNNAFTNNTGNPVIFDEPMQFDAGSSGGPTGTLCLNIATANSPAGGNNNSAPGTAGADSYRVRERVGATMLLQGLANGSNAATTDTFVANNNQTSGVTPATVFVQSGTYDGGTCTTPTEIGPVSRPAPSDAVSQNTTKSLDHDTSSQSTTHQPHEIVTPSSGPAMETPRATPADGARSYRSERAISHHAVRKIVSQEPNAPTGGESVTLNPIATFPAGGKSITIKYSLTVNTPPLARSVSTQGTVTANGGISVLTDDPEPVGAANPTVTNINTTVTWSGASTGDWNTVGNWTPAYVPGVANPGVNDVVIQCCNTPMITANDVDIFSLDLSSVVILSPGRTLQISGGAGSNISVTPDGGAILGGSLRFSGAGPHNVGGLFGPQGITSATTLLNPAVVNLTSPLQMGAVTVNSGATMNITGQTLSLKGDLSVPGGATFTTTGSTVVFNGSAAQQAAGITYNNLTINNTIGPFVTGVTLTGNATVNGTLTLTNSDLNTGAFTLTQPNTTASAGVSDVVGTVIRSGGPFALATPLTFGNPNNIITFTGGGTRPSALTVVMQKAAPATYLAAVQRNYQITPTGGAGFTATLRLHYLDSELNGNSETPDANFNLRKGPGWQAVVPTARNTAGTTDGWLENNAVTSFSQWTFATLGPTAAGGVVTGRIVDADGAPVEGAVVRLNGTQNRKFITDANGVYRFENVETNGLYTVTPSRPNYSFSPSVRSFSQLGETTNAAFGASLTSSGFVNPLDTPEYFVRQHYIDFLGREPDEAGFNFWSDQILECGFDQDCSQRRRENVSAAYFLSIEFQQTGGLVDRLYRASYGVRPNFGEFMPDTRTVGLGVVVGRDDWQALLETNTRAFVNAFVNRPTFLGVYGNMDNSSFIDALISHTGVTFTTAERDALASGLSTGAMTRADVVRSIAENDRFVTAKFNEAFVMMEYFGYLRRDPDANGYMFWLNKLSEFDGNFERADMVKAFIVSGEFRDRFPR